MTRIAETARTTGRILLPFAVSGTLLAFLYRRVDPAAIGDLLEQSDRLLLGVCLVSIVLLTWMSAVRYAVLANRVGTLSRGEAVRQILSASTLNLLLPSKLGDLAKAIFLSRGGTTRELAFAVVVLEKGLDLLALCAWGALALLVIPTAVAGGLLWGLSLAGAVLLGSAILLRRPKSGVETDQSSGGKWRRFVTAWPALRGRLAADRSARRAVIGSSLAIWLLHLLQLWVFLLALGVEIPFVTHAALASLAILAGLAPLTVGGVGTRDGAILFLYAAYLTPVEACAFGGFFFLRTLLPAIVGALTLSGRAERRTASPSLSA